MTSPVAMTDAVTLMWCAGCVAAVPSAPCPDCGGEVTAEVENRFVHASGRVIVWRETAAARQARYAKLSAVHRKISDEVLELARGLYCDEGLSMGEVAQAIFDAGLTAHAQPARLEEGLRRYFRRHGYPMRTTAATLAGRICRTEERCAATTRRGRSCQGNVVAGGFCWQHHPDYTRNRGAAAHMMSMRLRRRWVAELVPMQPFAAWLQRRREQLALPPEQRRWPDRDEGLARLSASTGIDASTLIKWMRLESSKGPKEHITESKVREVLERDGSASFEDLYAGSTP